MWILDVDEGADERRRSSQIIGWLSYAGILNITDPPKNTCIRAEPRTAISLGLMMKEMAKSATHRYRRRTTSLFSTVAAALALGAGGLLGSVSGSSVTEPLVPLDTATLTSNMRHWTTDYAVMFYAPWCNHCKYVMTGLNRYACDTACVGLLWFSSDS